MISVNVRSTSPARKQNKNGESINAESFLLNCVSLYFLTRVYRLHPLFVYLPYHHLIHPCTSSLQPSWSQTPSYDFKWRAATPALADALPVSNVRVTRITQLAGVTKDPAGFSAASPNPNRTSATTSRGPSAATNLCC